MAVCVLAVMLGMLPTSGLTTHRVGDTKLNDIGTNLVQLDNGLGRGLKVWVASAQEWDERNPAGRHDARNRRSIQSSSKIKPSFSASQARAESKVWC